MPRRRVIAKREIAPDPVYNSALVTKFINTVMNAGKRSTAEQILYRSFDIIKERTGDESGAWRVMLRSPDRRAFVFLRGSRTEAGVWRLIIDADDPSDFALLEPLARDLFAAASA